eukprot:704868_1
MEAETAVTNAKDKIQSQINKAKVAAQKASQNEDAKKRRDELCAKSQKAAEARKKDIEQTQKDIDKIRDKQKNAANQSNDNKPEPNNKAESNDNNDNDNDNNNKSEPNDNKPAPEPERIFETEEADDEEDGTMMKIFLSSKKMFKKLLEKKTWAGLGKLNKLFTLESVTDSLDNKKKGQKKFQFTLKFEEDFETIAPSGSERKKRESIYAFKTNVRRALCKRLNIGMNHITTGEPYEGSIYILIIIDRYGVEEFYQKYVVP